jgi:hypothetical protein
MRELSVSPADLKIGDVIKETERYCVVTSVLVQGPSKAIGLCSDEGYGEWSETAGGSGEHVARVGEGCEPTLVALKRFIEQLT